MKTAISLPEELFEEADRLAARLKKTRSEIYRTALQDYIARHDRDQVREQLDQALAGITGEGEPFVRAAAARILERSEW